jgi:hypothetical protein
MTQIVRKGVELAAENYSRRGFLGLMCKVGLAIGAAAGGTQVLPRVAYSACGCTPLCGPLGYMCPTPPAAHACPALCTGVAVTRCCDDGMGGTNTCHECHECNCGVAGNCFCDYDLGSVCPPTGC